MTDSPNPCGYHHPLPCALDTECPVPVAFFDADESSETIWERYKNE